MRGFVAVIGVASIVAALALVTVLAVTARQSGDPAGTIVFVILALIVALSTAYQMYRLLRRSAEPTFPGRNLSPIAVLLLFGTLVGLALVGAAVADAGHGRALLLPGLLIHLGLTCVARYKFAT